jgi:acetyltransferase-like isoleucine patch superfamily enzyme
MADNAAPLVIPRITVNEDVVTISHVAVEAGARVRAGDVVLGVSTDKADIDVEAAVDGHFWPLVQAGDRVPVGSVCAVVSPGPDRPPEAAPAPAVPLPSGEGRRATRRAEARARELGVDLSRIAARGIIRESDVDAFARGEGTAGAPAPSGAWRGAMEPEFLAAITQPGSGFAGLSSQLKVLLYRRHGAVIGEDVVIGAGSALYAETIEVGDGSRIGEGTTIRAQHLEIGAGALIGDGNDILCRRIRFGEMLYLVNRVVIGQGGAFNPESELVVGHSCLISSDCLVNTAHRVSIGDRSCLSPRVSVYTHSHWQNVLEGYRATCAPVEIGSDVWITGNCLVTPGTVMEDGSQALAGSTISGRVPARTIVSGVPAAPVGKVRGDLSPADKDRIMRDIWDKVRDAARAAGIDPEQALYAGTEPRGDAREPVQAAFGPCPSGYGGTYFDLQAYQVTGPGGRLADEVRNVLRKHGIRFDPHRWRYRADAGRTNA